MNRVAIVASGFRVPIGIIIAILAVVWSVAGNPPAGETQAKKTDGTPSEVIVYVADLPKGSVYEFDYVSDKSSPGGKMVVTPNTGEELDPPPENDPHVAFKVPVQMGIPYRCWIHMKVGPPKDNSAANLVWVQFSGAVDKSNKEIFKPGTGSYLTAHGPAQEGWTWVGAEVPHAGPSESLVNFRTNGEITVRIQAGMEGVGFDQILLSPKMFLEKPPPEAILRK